MRVRMYRMGSDPEFVFCTVKEWTHTLVPANTVITTNKALGLQTFIGVDGHAATAEIRPRAAHNVRLHLYDIAAAIDAIGSYISRHKRWGSAGLELFAQPYVQKEPLGGHIHLSMFVDDPVMARLQREYNRSYDREWTRYNPNAGTTPSPTSIEMELMAAHSRDVGNNQTVGMDKFGYIMHYLLLPFENWVQPWGGRLNRNSKYGANGDFVRRMYSNRPNMPKYNDWAYLHFEYRTPSSWLIHPWFAYAYLSLAKLTMLNWGLIERIVVNGGAATQPKIPGDNQPHNEIFFQQFKDRMYELEKKGLKMTKDLDDLKGVLRLITESRNSWTNPFFAVDIGAWRKLL